MRDNSSWLNGNVVSPLRVEAARRVGIGIFRTWVLSALCCVALQGQSASSSQQENPKDGGTAVASTQSDNPPRSTRSDDTFVIGNDDVLAINVWKDPDLSNNKVTVRSDGKISLALIGDVQAAGRTPLQLEVEITDRLKAYITDPQVAVIVQEVHSQKFNILGQVNKPGSYPLTAGTSVVDAIAIAGGLRDFAKRKGIYVLRQIAGGAEYKYPFNYDDFVKGKNTKQNIALKPHDTVFVP
jgi:polysaccharide biosynthesis/export protein